ncbi:MAG: exopolysaccharide Pel transporter PelG [Candidatus Wallbacteria bacterium]|nr:exopolysaccharide Pel transporter PelG [Candidatus Wallbacteria bacterium]
MAGIGFRIERLLDQDSYTGTFRAYLHAAVVSAGSMLATSACMGALVYFGRTGLNHLDLLRFQVTVTHVYCFGMLLIGPLQMVLHRYLADVFWAGRPEKVLPCLRGALAIHAALATPVAAAVLGAAGLPAVDVAVGSVLFGTTACIWVVSAFLSLCKAYEAVTGSFVLSLGVSFGAAWALGHEHGYTGLLAGFTSGHLLLLVMLYAQVVVEFPGQREGAGASLSWLTWARRYPWLVATGALCSLAIWADKLAFWMSAGAQPLLGPMRYHPIYDPCVFLGLLTAVPAFAHFLLVLETRFYRIFRTFCEQISSGAPYGQFGRTRDRMALMLREEFLQLAKLQGGVVLGVFFAAPRLLELAGMPEAYAHLVRAGSLAVSLGVGVNLHVVVLLYFDLQRDAALLAGFYAGASWALSRMSLTLGLRFYGYGYLAAGILALALGAWLVDRALGRMEFTLFRRGALRSLGGAAEEAIP